ncbi:glutathione S-transferase [Maricaulis sp.]|uniref:glutathione S-transferase n=1 Tax=Maricaulis sp. TaxID=1486257 RepID=UPI003A9579A6
MKLAIEDVINTTCPWSGLPVAADALTRYREAVVGFCNPGCRDKFEVAMTHFDGRLDRSASDSAIDTQV